jgi:D-amino-acid dehydrogenase
MSHTTTPPQRIAVIGAGMVGLSTAWYLQEQGAEVSVIESTSVAAGSSWGNAGWLTPGITTPLPEPAVLRTGIRAVLSPSSPVYVPPKADANLARFVAGFTRNSTAARWRRNMAALVPVNRMALDAFDELSAGGVQEPTRQASSFIAAYQRVEQRRTLLEEIEHIGHAGQEMSFEALTGDEARAIEPVLSDEIRAAILLKDQRFIDPGAYVAALAAAVEARGGQILTGLEVMAVDDRGESVILRGTRAGRSPSTPSSSPPGPGSGSTPASSACARSSRPAAATPSASRSTTCRPGRSTCPPPGSPARPSATGCGSRG